MEYQRNREGEKYNGIDESEVTMSQLCLPCGSIKSTQLLKDELTGQVVGAPRLSSFLTFWKSSENLRVWTSSLSMC